MLGENLADTADEGSGIKLCAHNFVGAVGQQRHSPVADERNKLTLARGFDVGAQLLSLRHSTLPLNIDQNHVIRVADCEGVGVGVGYTRINSIAGEAQNLVPKGTEYLSFTDVEDRLLAGSFVFLGAFGHDEGLRYD